MTRSPASTLRRSNDRCFDRRYIGLEPPRASAAAFFTPIVGKRPTTNSETDRWCSEEVGYNLNVGSRPGDSIVGLLACPTIGAVVWETLPLLLRLFFSVEERCLSLCPRIRSSQIPIRTEDFKLSLSCL